MLQIALEIYYVFIDGAVSFQHDKSILHLDLKPGNVLLTWDDGALMYAKLSMLPPPHTTDRS